MASINYYINQSVLGGTSAPRYADPLVTGAPNQDGLYPWSTFRARLATYDGSAVTAAVSVAAAGDPGAGSVNLLLFTSDLPAQGYLANSFTAVPARPARPEAQVGVAGAPAFFKTLPSSSTDVTVSAGQVGVGYVATGTAAPNDYISTTGFPATVQVPLEVVTYAELWLWANSPNICSPISRQNWDTVNTSTAATSGALPIVLLYSQYTQAIRNAGNIIVNTTGAIGATYQVVGLYSIGAA
jgi:hypothetical protein